MRRRLAFLAVAGLALAAPADAEAPAPKRAALAPSGVAVPMAPGVARYWPVVTRLAEATVVPAVLQGGKVQGNPQRTFDSRRPSDPNKPQTRRHVGVDLTAAEGDTVVAMEDGRIVAFYPFLTRAPEVGGEVTWAILIAHKGYVALYGEVRANSLSARRLKIGDTVLAGQPIGVVSGTAQLHTELYVAGIDRNEKWPIGAPPPPHMRNPTQFLLDTAANGRRLMPGSAPTTLVAAAP